MIRKEIKKDNWQRLLHIWLIQFDLAFEESKTKVNIIIDKRLIKPIIKKDSGKGYKRKLISGERVLWIPDNIIDIKVITKPIGVAIPSAKIMARYFSFFSNYKFP